MKAAVVKAHTRVFTTGRRKYFLNALGAPMALRWLVGPLTGRIPEMERPLCFPPAYLILHLSVIITAPLPNQSINLLRVS